MAHEPAEVVEYVASWNLDVRDLWLAEVDGHVVGLRQGIILATAFHPELTDDTRIHELFLSL